MSDGLDVIIVDDDPDVCGVISEIIKKFYTWGEVISFTDTDEAISYCMNRDIGVAIFVLDVFLGKISGFYFLDTIESKFTSAHEDTIIITGHANDDVVNMCVASNVNYLLEKPVKTYALQLSIRAIAQKYLRFAKKLLQDPDYARNIGKF